MQVEFMCGPLFACRQAFCPMLPFALVTPLQDAKKNLLKVNGTSWLVFAAQGVYNAQDDILRKVCTAGA